MSLRLAILGRPNVGKSTLFNRLVGKRLALVDDRPGVTRDRREGQGRLSDLNFTVIDTAGLEEAESGTLEARMRQQTERAAELSDVILFLIDGRVGVTPMDEHFANWLRHSGKPVILMVNKCEGKAGDSGYLDAFSLGLGDPLKFSAEHGEGLSDLYDALREHADRLDTGPAEEAEPIIQLAVVGRPNAGKSTLVNALIGEQRMLVGPEAGITRDSVSVEWQVDDQIIRLVDTAGLRRKAKVTDKLEKLSVADALRAMQYAQVVLIVIDATSPLDKQDKVLADLVAREGRAPIIVLNKWDLVDNKTELKREIEDLLDFGLS
ncbi:MAG: ribosome biogenesis GTPase Der, partial [Alphaproteobacteria bacterium]|nr:ribosome biogenesis GTPase Der [Alphaproteobacteria bacterium]